MMEIWKSIRADLTKARDTLPQSAASLPLIRDYHNYLDSNELELACEMLEAYADDHVTTPAFWLALRDAALKMKLADYAERYARRASAGE